MHLLGIIKFFCICIVFCIIPNHNPQTTHLQSLAMEPLPKFQHNKNKAMEMERRIALYESDHHQQQSSGGVWKSRWPSWAPVPNKPTVSVDVKQRSTNKKYINSTRGISSISIQLIMPALFQSIYDLFSPKRERKRKEKQKHCLSAAILRVTVCLWRHKQSRHMWQTCTLRHEPFSFSVLFVKSKPVQLCNWR